MRKSRTTAVLLIGLVLVLARDWGWALARLPSPQQIVSSQPPALEPASGQTERPGHVFLFNGIEASYLYRAFIQIALGMAWGPDGKLYIGDAAGRHVVRLALDGTMDDLGLWRRSDMWGQPPENPRDVVPGPQEVAFDSAGNLYVGDCYHIYVVEPDGTADTLLSGISTAGIAFDSSDVLHYTDFLQGQVLKVGADGTSQVVASGIENAEDLAFGLDGTLYVGQASLDRVVQVDVTTGEVSEFFSHPLGGCCELFLAVESDGDIWIRGPGHLYQIGPDGTEKPYTINGISGSGEAPEGWNLAMGWFTTGGIAFDPQGGLWVGTGNGRVLRLNPPSPGLESEGMSISVVHPGLYPADLDTGPEGDAYTYNRNTEELWRVNPQGDVEVLAQLDAPGPDAVAVDREGSVYVSLPQPHGEIARLEADGSLSHYAPLVTTRMVFGADGYLYAAVGDPGQPKSIVRITGVDTYEILTSEIDGQPLGAGYVDVAAAPGDGLYLWDGEHTEVYYVDFGGQGRVVANLGGPPNEPVHLAVPRDGDIFVSMRFKVFRMDPDGDIEEYAFHTDGDPSGMATSPDARWLYVAESGAIDQIPILGEVFLPLVLKGY